MITDLNVWQVYFDSEEVYACIVTCGGLCPGLNTVIREIVCGLYHMYGVHRVLGIEVPFMLQKPITYVCIFFWSCRYFFIWNYDSLAAWFVIFLLFGDCVSLKYNLSVWFKFREDIEDFILEIRFL